MKIRILGWSCENIRQFKNLKFNMADEEEGLPHIYLVMMRNGTGKTTTTELIRAVLSGTELTKKEILSYKPTTYKCENGKFTLIMSYGRSIYYYILELDYVNGVAKYYTSMANDLGGLEEGRKVPIALNVFNNKEFINRFIFDGEQAQLTLSTGNQEAEKAITYLYQVNKLDDLIGSINTIIEQKRRESTGGETEQSIKNLKTRAMSKHDSYMKLVEDRKRLSKEREEISEKIEEYNKQKEKLIDANESLKEQKSELENKKANILTEMDKYFRSIRAEYRMPYQIHEEFDNRLKTLVSNMQTLKLPKTTAREFFVELSQKDTCLCGRPITNKEKNYILNNAERYLGEDELTVINAIKHALNKYKKSNELMDSLKELGRLKEEIDIINGQIEDLKNELNLEDIKEVEEIDRSIKKLEPKLMKIKGNLEILNATGVAVGINEKNNIELAKKAYESSKRKLDEATHTFTFTSKAEKVVSYIKSIKALTLKKLKATILVNVNNRLNTIITNDDIRIDKIDGNIVLHDRERVSEGQTLAIAYAYVGSLFEHSPHDFTFLVDSPAAKMDLDVRREVARVLPKLFKQLIIFVTSGETEGFGDELYLRDDVKYVTIEAEGNKKTKCIRGQEYFSKYQHTNVEEVE